MKSHESSFNIVNNAGRDVKVGEIIHGDVYGGVRIDMSSEGSPTTSKEESDSDNDINIPFQVGKIHGEISGIPPEYSEGVELYPGDTEQPVSDNVEDAETDSANEATEETYEADAEATHQHTEDQVREQHLEEIRDELRAAFHAHEEAPETAEAMAATQTRVLEQQSQLSRSSVKFNNFNGASAILPGSAEPLSPGLNPRQVTGHESARRKPGKVKSFIKRYLLRRRK